MFAQWNVSVVLQERFAQLRRGKKFESDNGHAMDEELAPHEISQAARGRDDCARYGRQRQGRNRLEPPQHDTLPSVRKRNTRMKADKSLVLLAHYRGIISQAIGQKLSDQTDFSRDQDRIHLS